MTHVVEVSVVAFQKKKQRLFFFHHVHVVTVHVIQDFYNIADFFFVNTTDKEFESVNCIPLASIRHTSLFCLTKYILSVLK